MAVDLRNSVAGFKLPEEAGGSADAGGTGVSQKMDAVSLEEQVMDDLGEVTL
jgi:hypothetical protein